MRHILAYISTHAAVCNLFDSSTLDGRDNREQYWYFYTQMRSHCCVGKCTYSCEHTIPNAHSRKWNTHCSGMPLAYQLTDTKYLLMFILLEQTFSEPHYSELHGSMMEHILYYILYSPYNRLTVTVYVMVIVFLHRNTPIPVIALCITPKCASLAAVQFPFALLYVADQLSSVPSSHCQAKTYVSCKNTPV